MGIVWCVEVGHSTALGQLQQKIFCQNTPIDTSAAPEDYYPWIGECAQGCTESAVHVYMQGALWESNDEAAWLTIGNKGKLYGNNLCSSVIPDGLVRWVCYMAYILK